MTENPNETLCSTQFYNQIKRELTNSAITNDVALCLYNGTDVSNKQLTDSNLKYNVQIVLENLRRSAEKTYLNHNNNNNTVPASINNVNSSNCNAHNINQTNKNLKAIGLKNNNNNCDTSSPSRHPNNARYSKRSAASGKMSSPESDCNSNLHINPLQQLATSIASSHDFTHDNSDYQWFLDYK